MASKATIKTKRRRLRRRLEAQGYSPAAIERMVASFDARRAFGDTNVTEAHQHAARARAQESQLDELHAVDECKHVALDDRKHRPAKHDSLLTGQARATGLTAVAVRRAKALTKWEWDELDRREGRAG